MIEKKANWLACLATMQIKEEAAELLDTLAERQGGEMGNCVECSAR